jgi:hypothetical protein
LDSDNDGIPDVDEAGDDPKNPVDTDKDGLPDYRDIDSNNDGINDNETLLISKSSTKPKLQADGSFTMSYTIKLRIKERAFDKYSSQGRPYKSISFSCCIPGYESYCKWRIKQVPQL